MIDTGYLYSKDSKRIFINTCLGCEGQCSYCYLPVMGYDNKSTNLEVKKAEELIKQIEKIDINKETLITLGCFSECWNDRNKLETIELIRYFLKKGNQIQLSTKKEIKVEELKEFDNLIQYLGQLVIFVSSATISEHKTIEKGTDSPEKRFNTFNISKKMNIPTVLYMKPVLKEITVKDIELYKSVIKKYEVKDVVVGSIFGENKTEETIHFSDNKKLFYNQILDELQIKQKLMKLDNIRIFSRSSQVMKFYKEKELER